MNETSSSGAQPTGSPSAGPFSGKWLVVLLAVAIAASALALWLWRGRRPGTREVIVEMAPPETGTEAPAVYTAEVIDAINRRDLQAEVGRRYKVVIEDESKEGNAGIARIGGLVTFVRDAQVGDIVIIEVTRMKKTSAEARLVRRIETAVPAERKSARAKLAEPGRGRRESPVVVGGVYTGVVEDVGRKGAGIVRIQGKVVFVEGVQKGEEVVFRVVEDADRYARAELAALGAASEFGPRESVGSKAPSLTSPRHEVIRDGAEATAEDVQNDCLFEVTVAEVDKKNPERNGVARIGGLVVFVPDSRPGERVVIRIKERRPRFAFAEVVEKKMQQPAP